MAENFEFDWRDQWFSWTLIGIFFLFIQHFIVADTLGYGYGYGVSFLMVAYMLFIDQFGKKEPNSYGFLVGAFFATAAIFVADITFPLGWLLALCIIAIVFIWYVQNQNDYKFGLHTKNVKYFAVVPMLTWSLWAFLFLSTALSETVIFEQLMYQGGILLFGAWSSLRLLGITGIKEGHGKVSIVLAVIVICGMLLISSQLGLPLRTLSAE